MCVDDKEIGHLFKRFVSATLERAKLPSCAAAINLLTMIAGHESGGFRYVKQKKGPALGLLQMEPNTYDDLRVYAKKRRGYTLPASSLSLVFDTALAIRVARIFFLRKPEPLPDFCNSQALANYAKQHWNTVKGKAKITDYMRAYERFCV